MQEDKIKIPVAKNSRISNNKSNKNSRAVNKPAIIGLQEKIKM